MLFSTVRWAQMVRLFHPWPLHKAPGGHCGSLWRVCLWSSLCCLTKPLSRYSRHSFIATTCSCLKLALGNKCCAVMSSGQTGGGWCCGKTESFPGFAAVVQSESVTLLFCFFFPPASGILSLFFDVCMFHMEGLTTLTLWSTFIHHSSTNRSCFSTSLCCETPWHQYTPMTLDPPPAGQCVLPHLKNCSGTAWGRV